MPSITTEMPVTAVENSRVLTNQIKQLVRTIVEALVAKEPSSQVAERFKLDHDDDEAAVILPGIFVGVEDGDIDHLPVSTADAAANAVAATFDRPDPESPTYWIKVRTFRLGVTVEDDEDGQPQPALFILREQELRRAIHPVEPDRNRRQDWRSPHAVVGGIKENPGVRGNAGGVVTVEVCALTGWYQITDTWATDPADGTQGHTSIRYQRPDDVSLSWVASLAEDPS